MGKHQNGGAGGAEDVGAGDSEKNIAHDAADLKQLLLVVHHLGAR